MSPPSPRVPTRAPVPRGLQAGAGAGSPPLQPLSPVQPASPLPHERGSPSAAAEHVQWQFGSIPPLPFIGGVAPPSQEDHEMADAGASRPPSAVGMSPELAALHALNARLEAENVALREQVRARDRSLKRCKAMRSSLADRLREVEADARGLRQERGALGDALSLMEDERDELAVRVRDLQARVHELEEELEELRLAMTGRVREVYWERELNRLTDVENVRLKRDLDVAVKVKEAESSRFVKQLRALVVEMRNRVPRQLYERSFRRAQAAAPRAGPSSGAGRAPDPSSVPPSSPPAGSPATSRVDVNADPADDLDGDGDFPIEGVGALVDADEDENADEVEFAAEESVAG
ncbi:hypothetical protein FB107DRAFT_279939 [Schizophyllum commune]